MPRTNINKHTAKEVQEIFQAAWDDFEKLASNVSKKLHGMDAQQWESYCKQTTKTFTKIVSKMDKLDKDLSKALDNNDHKEAAKIVKKGIGEALKFAETALVFTAESMGINRLLRKLGIVDKTPNDIMKKLRGDLGVEVKEKGKKAAKKIDKFVGKVADKVKKGIDKVDRALS
jgi:DNA anti-recombination protein RmuC